MSMIGNLIRFGRRQLHTIVSREIIKPSSPTPSHLKTYNLSLFDQIGLRGTYIPYVIFYPSNIGIYRSSHDKTLDLKKSLSQTLAKYYPFAGRFSKKAPTYVDCNDDGAEFLEASIDSTLTDYLQNSKREDLHQFFPYRRVWNHDGGEGDKVIPLAVQVNHFKCGGVAVAVSLAHKIADGPSAMNFTNDWAKMTRFSSHGEEYDQLSINPQFASNPNININFEGFTLLEGDDTVTRSFIFPDAKINDLKLKVIAMTAESEEPITNPTRVEVLNWLLYKCAVAAATTNNSKFSEPTSTGFIINIRNKMMEHLPYNRIGNHFMIMKIFTNNESDLKPERFINDIKKEKMKIHNLRNIEEAFDLIPNLTPEIAIKEQNFIDRTYLFSSVCGYPTYGIDFGWGKPVKATCAGNMNINSFLLFDAPDGDGIEALVCLGKQDMANMENDPELHAFC